MGRGALSFISLHQPQLPVSSVSHRGSENDFMCVFFLKLSLFQHLKIHRCEVPSSWEVLFWELEVGVGRVKHYSAKERGWASVTF